jgi:putative peptidoglycan lipid II flippase
MIKRVLRNGSNLLTGRQTNILSAAVVIMVMIAMSRVLGLVRNRVLAHFFTPEILSVYFAAFRLPEVVFEVLVFGTLSSAFIPTFTAYCSKNQRSEAWYIASVSLNFALLFFLILAVPIFIFARQLYQILAPGFNSFQLDLVSRLTRVLLIVQGFFLFSYFLTGVLESLERFLIPAIAPLFYNLGIIFGALFLSNKFGIMAPVIGAVIGSFLHFFIQLPLAIRLGFRPKISLNYSHPGVREIARLATPRVFELSFLEIGKSAELFLASLISTGAYTYYTFANSLQLLPVGLFGISLAKASLPSLSYRSAQGDYEHFKSTFLSLFIEIAFFIIPCSVFLAVLRIPIIRLTFGAARFTWESTIQTGLTLSAFCLGLFAQSINYLLNRAFWALHDTKTSVKVSIICILINIILGAVFIIGLHFSVWSLALAFSLSMIVQALFLFLILYRKLGKFQIRRLSIPLVKITLASLISGSLMFVLLKVFDRPVWDKRLSFLRYVGLTMPTTFDRFVLDTRYTGNLLVLTGLVGLIGVVVYLLLVWFLGVKEVALFTRVLSKIKGLKEPLIIDQD